MATATKPRPPRRARVQSKAKPQRVELPDLSLIARTVFSVSDEGKHWIDVVEICETPEIAQAYARGFNTGEEWQEAMAFAGVDALQSALARHVEEGGA